MIWKLEFLSLIHFSGQFIPTFLLNFNLSYLQNTSIYQFQEMLKPEENCVADKLIKEEVYRILQ